MPLKDKEKRKAYHKKYMKKWYAENKEKVFKTNRQTKLRIKERLDKYKLEKGCIQCGYNKCSEALDFDHIGNNKTDCVSNMMRHGLAWSTILAEIDKCELVCSNCHRERTVKRRNNCG